MIRKLPRGLKTTVDKTPVGEPTNVNHDLNPEPPGIVHDFKKEPTNMTIDVPGSKTTRETFPGPEDPSWQRRKPRPFPF